jgi:hypothetical protein
VPVRHFFPYGRFRLRRRTWQGRLPPMGFRPRVADGFEGVPPRLAGGVRDGAPASPASVGSSATSPPPSSAAV